MAQRPHFSKTRLLAIIRKEFIQIKRDRYTFAMLIGIPLVQLILFGFAINTNPKFLPTAVLQNDYSSYTRTFLAAMKNTEYFSVTKEVKTERDAKRLLARGDVLFLVTIPTYFTRQLMRGERPDILVEVDASDPVATGNAISALNVLVQTVFNDNLRGGLQYLKGSDPPAGVIVHNKYNPENITQYNIVPALLGVVLTMTMVLITSLAITRERERGTMENLLATPLQPLEVMVGKIIPYIVVGYIQVTFILLASYFVFQVPIEGSLILLYLTALPFIAANLAVGLTFSSLAASQLQAMQLAFFFFLPSILLSGFIFPFLGMPNWAQWLGSLLPLSYFLRIVRGILLKGNGIADIADQVWPIIVFTIVVMFIGAKRYRRTLD